MKIENLKELQQLIKLCRKEGIEAVEVDNIKMNLGPLPTTLPKAARKHSVQVPESVVNPTFTPGGITEDTKIVTSELTDEQLLFWSAQGQLAQQNEQQ